MSETAGSLWRAILFYRITNWDWLLSRDNNLRWRFPAKWLRRRRESRNRLADVSVGFDLRWARWLVTLTVFLPAAIFFPGNPVPEWTAALGTGAFAILLCAYFAFLLFRRLQCSLLEFIALTAFLGNAEGLVLTTPFLMGLGPGAWSLGPLVAGWVFYGTVMTLVEAKVLGLEKPLPRLLLLFGNWYVLAAPAMLFSGACLHYVGSDRQLRGLVSRNMAAWSVPLLVAGGAGCVLWFWLSRMTRRAAREILRTGS